MSQSTDLGRDSEESKNKAGIIKFVLLALLSVLAAGITVFGLRYWTYKLNADKGKRVLMGNSLLGLQLPPQFKNQKNSMANQFHFELIREPKSSIVTIRIYRFNYGLLCEFQCERDLYFSENDVIEALEFKNTKKDRREEEDSKFSLTLIYKSVENKSMTPNRETKTVSFNVSQGKVFVPMRNYGKSVWGGVPSNN